jgi:flagellar basal-body rod protein FlgC
MDYSAAFQISASGMAVEKTRLEVTAMNLANMHSAAASAAQAYRPLKVITQAQPLTFAQHLGMLQAQAGGGVRVVSLDPSATPARLVYEPGHPYADHQGMVAYPAVDHTAEMLQLNTALRAYEANVVAMNAARTMASRTLEIGGQ